MFIGSFAGKQTSEARIRSTLLAVLAGAVIGMPSSVHAQSLVEGGLFADLRVDIEYAAGVNTTATWWPNWRPDWRPNGVGTTLRQPGRTPPRTNLRRFATPEQLVTNAHWAAAASGSWSDPSRWTTSPFYPNNGNPLGTTYNVFLDAIGPNHVVTLDTDVDLQSLVIDSISTEFLHRGSNRISTVNSIDLLSGTYRLDSGVLADSTLNLLGGVFAVHGSVENVFRNMTVNGDFAIERVQGFGGFLRVQDGLALNGTITLRDTTNQLAFENTQTLTSGTIRFEQTQWEPSQLNVAGDATFTIGSAAVVRGGDGEMGERWGGGSGTNAIVNNGLISADLAGQSIGIYTNPRQQAGDTFSNNGTIEAIGGGELIVEHFVGDVNTARVDGAGSKMSFDGSYTINSPINVSNASELTLNGSWANVAGINVTENSLLRLGGTMTAGTLGPLNTAGGNVHLLGEYSNVGATLAMDGNWKIAGGTITGGTVTKAGSPLETVPGTQSAFSQLTYSGDLLIPSSTLIATDVSLVGNTTVQNGVLDLRGAWSTTGVVTANQSTLRLGGNFDFGSYGSFVRTNAPVEMTGSLDLQGNTLALDPAQGTFTLYSGSLSNGVVDASLGTPLTVAQARTGNLTDIRLLGTFSITNASASTQNLINEGTLQLGNRSTLELLGNWSSPGLIDMQSVPSKSTLIMGGTFGSADLAGLTVRNNLVEVRGVMDNTANTLTVGATGDRWWLDGGTIAGGTLEILSPQAFTTFGSTSSPRYLTSRLDGVNIVGNFVAEYLTLSNGTSLTGTLTLERDNASLVFDGTQTFTGGVISAVPLAGSTHEIYIEPGSTLTLDSTTTIRGGGTVIGRTTTGLGTNSLINNGNIVSSTSGESLLVAATTLTNNGVLDVRNGGTMSIDGGLTNTGTLRAVNGGAMIASNMLGSVGTVDLAGIGSSLNLDGTYSIDSAITVNPGTSLTLNGDWTNNALIQMTNGEVNLGGFFSASGASGFSRSGGTVNLIGTFDNTGSIFELNATTGPWALKGGTFLGGTLALRNGIVLEATGTATGTLDNVIVDGNVLLTSGTLVSKNGSQFTGTARFAGGELQLVGDHTFDNTTFEFAGPGSWLHAVDPQGPTTLTFGSNFVASGSDGLIGSQLASQDDDTIINRGLLLGNQPGGPLTIQPKTFVNEGVVRAASGGSIVLDVTRSSSPWTNAGSLDVHTGGLLHLKGAFSTPGLGTMNRSGGEVRISGTLDNTGSTITLSDALGGWSLEGATLNGGVVQSLDNRRLGLLQGAQPNRFTGGVTVNGDLSLAGELIVSDGAVFNGNVDITGGTLNFEGNQTLASGTLLFSGPQPGTIGVTNGAIPGTLTLGSGVSILGQSGQIGALPGAVSDTIVNQGLIRSDQAGGTITVSPATFVNTGNLEVGGGGTLVLDTTASPVPWINQGRIGVEPGGLVHLKGTYSLTGLGTLDRTGGDMRLTGVLDNTGSTFNINNTVGGLELDGAEIVGGVIDIRDGRQLGLIPGANKNRLTSVAIDGDWMLEDSPWISGGLAVNGTLQLNDKALFIEGSQTFTQGIFDFAGTGLGSFAIRSTGARPILTLAPGVVVHGGEGTLGSFNPNYDDGLVNQGLISSDVAGKELRISSDVFENQGVVEARNGGTMRIGTDEWSFRPMQWSSTGTLRADGGTLRLGGQTTTADLGIIENVNGGTVILSGSIDNNNATLNIDSPGQQWLSWGTIAGGAVNVAAGTPVSFSGLLDAVALTGNVEASHARIRNGLTLNGSITLIEPNAQIIFDGTQRFDTGSIIFDASAGFRKLTMTGGTTLTIGPAATIVGGLARIGERDSLSGRTHLVNEGTIRANVAGTDLMIAPFLFDNRGTLEVVNGATLTIGKSVSNSTVTNNFGLIDVSDGLLDIGGTFSQLGGTLHQTGGQIQLSGTMQNSFSTFTLDGPNAIFDLDGTIVEGTINVLNGAQFAVPERGFGVLDGVTLNGPIEMQGGPTRASILDFVNGVTLDNGQVNLSGENALLRFFSTTALDGGTIVFSGTPTSDQQLQIADNNSLMLGTNVTIRGGGATIAKTVTGQPTTLVNQGLIQASLPGNSLFVLADSFSSSGVLEATTGSSLFVGLRTGTWSNTGTLRAAGGRLVLDGAFTTSSLSGLENIGGNVWLVGQLDNTGATLTLNSTTGGLELEQGRITGGTIVQTQGAELGLALVPGFGHGRGELVDVSLVGDLNMPFVGGEWSILGSFDLDGDVVIGGRDNSINFNRRELDNLTVHFNGTGIESNRISGADIGVGAVVRGGRGGINDIQYNKGRITADVPNTSIGIGGGDFFVNEGTIEVLKDSKVGIFFNSGWTNPGLIRVNEGVLSVGGEFASKVFQNMDRIGGDVRLFNADIDNTNTSWTLQPGPWTILSTSSIKGGSINIGPLSSFAISGITTFTDVAINGDLFMPDAGTTLLIKGDLDLAGTLSMTSPMTNLFFSHNGTLLNGTVFFDGAVPGERKIRAINDTTFTIGAPAIIHGGSGEIFTGTSSTVINQGLVSADMLDQAITITTKRFDNQGTLEAINGGELILIESPDQIGPMPAAFLHNAGILNLGENARLVVGGFLQERAGVTSMDISANGRFGSAAYMHLFSPAWLAGTLDVELLGTPRFGDEFRLFKWSGVNGEFDSVVLPQLPGTLRWDAASLYQTGVIQIVPSPASVSLLIGAGAFVASGRRRRSMVKGDAS